MLVHHLAGFLVRHFAVKRVDGAVVRPLLPAPALRLFHLVLFKLAGVLPQVAGALLVAHPALVVVGVVGVLRDVVRPDSFLLTLGRPLARDVTGMVARRAAPAHFDRHEHAAAAHPLNSRTMSFITRSTACIARSSCAFG
ncbi:MAG: hypothetical protein M3430_08610 [Acidobacteriota bacterium]|nr:hypothetical protein [Acidobacteriota bacterium]